MLLLIFLTYLYIVNLEQNALSNVHVSSEQIMHTVLQNNLMSSGYLIINLYTI